MKSAVCVSVCQGPAGLAVDGADFGPDYQSPSQRLPQAGALARAFTYGTTKEACSSAAPRDAARGHLSRKSFGTPRRSAPCPCDWVSLGSGRACAATWPHPLSRGEVS